RTHPRKRLIADAPRLVELLNEVVDRPLILWGGFRHAPLMQVTNGLRLDAGPLGLRHMGEPFVLGAPESCRDQNREFGEARRHPRIEAAIAAGLLREFPESGRVQKHREWAADRRAAAARAGANRLEQRALGGRQLVLVQNGEPRRRYLLGRFFRRHRAPPLLAWLTLWPQLDLT